MDHDRELETAIRKAVNKRFLKGQNHETRMHHHVAVFRQVADLLNLPLPLERDEKLKQLFGTSFQSTDLHRLLDEWIRKNSIAKEKLIKTRDIFYILSVDGFKGLTDLKPYLEEEPDGNHIESVRAMYLAFDKKSSLQSLTGTDSACVVFVTLLMLFSNKILDDNVKMLATSIKKRIEGGMLKRAQYYKDIRLVNENVMKELISIYVEKNPKYTECAKRKTDSLIYYKKYFFNK
ncbi:uncharacterized protein TNCT_229551 [Trichonephila clavata]|uniref:Uncharacterized protein n=1 Tax=Trichonephila clavata TaxID=2740835 RepID=A0A8X6GXD2_TRICU|nr:uncharacterized protein TNCT_556091 [Trichonephila clavata]GFR12288.1 uncharacterized protein TNCT_103481 [Trichonephila clavata]GFR29525.1 uncharacterized protein TNCT_229551 [Trichonephila clavata]